MHDIFIIKELLEHILSFVPRKLIISCALTCKRFHDAITIDYNQDNVAKNSDMFSLLKIPYYTKAVINVAAKYKNNEIINYLINKNINLLDDFGVFRSIGYIGSESLISKLKTNYISTVIIGICEGLHFDLFEKYKNKLYNRDLFDVIKVTYKSDCKEMIYNVISYCSLQFGGNEDIEYGEICGKCARENEKDVLSYIKTLMRQDNFDDDPEYINFVCEGLIEGNHHDILVWFLNQEIVKNNGGYYCENNELVRDLVVNNKIKMFCDVVSTHCLKWTYKGYYVVNYGEFDWAENHHLDFCVLVELCIDYRRIEILTFLIEHIRFNLIRYQEFVNKSQLLQFDDITNVLITNKHLFIDYVE